MKDADGIVFDPALDLRLERRVDVPVELVWQAWTRPEHLLKWFTPAPWRTVECELELRPGGIFRTVMQSPEGERFPGIGCYLEVVEHRRLSWTNTLAPGFRPAQRGGGKECDDFPFTAVIALQPEGNGTRYTALAMHATPADCKAHADMGFHDGWSTALDQLVALAKTL